VQRLDLSRLLMGVAVVVGLMILVLWWTGDDEPGGIDIGSATTLQPDSPPGPDPVPGPGPEPDPVPGPDPGPGPEPGTSPPGDPDGGTGDGSDAPEEAEWPELADEGEVGAAVTPTGVVVAVTGSAGNGRFEAISPCGNEVEVEAEPLRAAHVLLDPGHGGPDRGAVGPGGLVEADLNLQVAEEVRRRLEQAGATVALTRTDDYWLTTPVRRRIAAGVDADLLVSIHYNADPAGPSDSPGTETYFPRGSPEARRAAGLLWEELVEALAAHDADWVANDDAGVAPRTGTEDDYYGILAVGGGTRAVLVEVAFITNPSEEEVLGDPEVVEAQAEAIARAAERFLTTEDQGSGFVEPDDEAGDPKAPPPGPACEDPPLE
jgi:N-acetylmuramoyl-L-alanine amidase